MSGKEPAQAMSLCNGEWISAEKTRPIIDPMNGEEFLIIPDHCKLSSNLFFKVFRIFLQIFVFC